MLFRQHGKECSPEGLIAKVAITRLLISALFVLATPFAAFGDVTDKASASWLLSYGASSNSATAEDEVLESLYRKGLNQIAVERCEQELRQSGISRFTRSQWTARLITSLAVRDSSMESIEVALESALTVAKPFLGRTDVDVNVLWTRFALLNARFVVTDRHAAAFLATPANQTKREACLASIRTINDSLIEFRDEVHAVMSTLSKSSGRDASNGVLDLAALKNQSLLLQINATLLRARLYDPQSTDAVAAASETISVIERALSTTEEKWSGRASLELANWEAMRLVGRYAEASVGLEEWMLKYPSSPLILKAVAIGLESSIDAKAPPAVLKWLAKLEQLPQSERSPDLAIAQLKSMIFEWHVSRSEGEAEGKKKLNNILEKRDQIASAFGKYWALRAEAVILASQSIPSLTGNPSVSQSSSSESFTLIKLQIKQLIAANRVADAIDRLSQSESIASKDGNNEQAFEFAKLQIALKMRQLKEAKDLSDAARIKIQMDIADQIEETSAGYHLLPNAVELNRLAESLIRESSKLESDPTESSRYWRRYEQHLSDHLELWPKDPSSIVVREQLVTSFLLANRTDELVKIWEMATMETPEREERLIDAMLLRIFMSPQEDLSSSLGDSTNSLSASAQNSLCLLAGDWSWWKQDGGVNRILSSKNASQSLMVLLGQLNSSRFDTDRKSPIQLVPFLLSRLTQAKPNVQSDQTANTKSDLPLNSLCQWVQNAPERRIGWGLALSKCTLSILDGHVLNDLTWMDQESCRQTALETLLQLRDMFTEGGKSSNTSFHPSLSQSIQHILISLNARINALNNDIAGSAGTLLRLKAEFPRDPKWHNELATLQFWICPSEKIARIAAIEKSISIYQELAAGNPVGSDRWLDARVRTADCYRTLEKWTQAANSVSLIKALVGNVPAKWEPRLLYLEQQLIPKLPETVPLK